jgi:hypothetical protein
VPPQSKRRRLSLLTLPVVVVAGFLLVAKLASWQRSDLIADLADCISHGETRDAIEAVHKLATIPNPPIPVLVTAAACDEHETAGAAQVAIDRILRRWQRDVESKKQYSTVASQLSELAKSLAETQTDFSDSDHAWLESTVRKILRIANKFPPAKTPLVAVHCDAILTAIGAGRFPARPDDLPGADDFDGAIAGVPNGKAASPPEFAPSTDLGEKAGQGADEKGHSAENAMTPFNPSAATDPLMHADNDTAGNLSDDPSVNDLGSRGDGSDEAGASGPLSSRSRLSRRSFGAPQIFRILPASPINVSPSDSQTSNRMSPDSRTSAEGMGQASRDPLATVESRELLRTWFASEGGDTQPIEHELGKRGFGKLSKPLVKQYFSEKPEDRMRLVDHVLAQPGGGSEAWLLLLARDSDPDVRLFAITFMATSNNAAMVEKSWQAAIRDHDPRIADLADRLRERREGPLRR